jgi:hypothetical protein
MERERHGQLSSIALLLRRQAGRDAEARGPVRAVRVRHEPLTSGQSEPAPMGLLSGYMQYAALSPRSEHGCFAVRRRTS